MSGTYKVKLISDEFGIEEFTYSTPAEQYAGAGRLMEAALREYQNDQIYRAVVICIGEEPKYGEEVERL